MTKTHIPVLAGELIEVLDPSPGRLAVDCTFGSGGHARLVADRLGARGELVCIDRDPHAQERFDEFAADVPCATRFIRGDYADVLPELAREGLRADLVYMDLGVSSFQVDTRERGFSYSYDAPLDMRMDPDQELDARAVVNEWPEERLTSIFRDCDQARRAGAGAVRRRTPCAARVPGDQDRRQRRAVLARPRVAGGLGAPAPWGADGGDLLPFARGSPRQALLHRARARVHLPAGDSGLRVRPRAARRARDPQSGQAVARRDRAESALEVRAAARSRQARGG
jgi:hypothetical protein